MMACCSCRRAFRDGTLFCGGGRVGRVGRVGRGICKTAVC